MLTCRINVAKLSFRTQDCRFYALEFVNYLYKHFPIKNKEKIEREKMKMETNIEISLDKYHGRGTTIIGQCHHFVHTRKDQHGCQLTM